MQYIQKSVKPINLPVCKTYNYKKRTIWKLFLPSGLLKSINQKPGYMNPIFLIFDSSAEFLMVNEQKSTVQRTWEREGRYKL